MQHLLWACLLAGAHAGSAMAWPPLAAIAGVLLWRCFERNYEGCLWDAACRSESAHTLRAQVPSAEAVRLGAAVCPYSVRVFVPLSRPFAQYRLRNSVGV